MGRGGGAGYEREGFVSSKKTVKIDDIPDSLPPHPDEARLREGEKQLAETLRSLVDEIATALENDDPDKTKARVHAAVGLQRLKDTADAGRAAEARALDDQMQAARKS